jgi:hypothetical protein
MANFRALCQELMDTIDSGVPVDRIKQSPLAVRIDAALAEPEVPVTDAEKVAALTDLLGEVISALDLTQYDIEDPSKSHAAECQADAFTDRMFTILHGETTDA